MDRLSETRFVNQNLATEPIYFIRIVARVSQNCLIMLYFDLISDSLTTIT
jgi:hypothetical protein